MHSQKGRYSNAMDRIAVSYASSENEEEEMGYHFSTEAGHRTNYSKRCLDGDGSTQNSNDLPEKNEQQYVVPDVVADNKNHDVKSHIADENDRYCFPPDAARAVSTEGMTDINWCFADIFAIAGHRRNTARFPEDGNGATCLDTRVTDGRACFLFLAWLIESMGSDNQLYLVADLSSQARRLRGPCRVCRKTVADHTERPSLPLWATLRRVSAPVPQDNVLVDLAYRRCTCTHSERNPDGGLCEHVLAVLLHHFHGNRPDGGVVGDAVSYLTRYVQYVTGTRPQAVRNKFLASGDHEVALRELRRLYDVFIGRPGNQCQAKHPAAVFSECPSQIQDCRSSLTRRTVTRSAQSTKSTLRPQGDKNGWLRRLSPCSRTFRQVHSAFLVWRAKHRLGYTAGGNESESTEMKEDDQSCPNGVVSLLEELGRLPASFSRTQICRRLSKKIHCSPFAIDWILTHHVWPPES